MKKKVLNAISTIAMALVMFVLPVFSTIDSSVRVKSQDEYIEQTRTVSADIGTSLDSLYFEMKEQCDDVSLEYNEENNNLLLSATQTIPAQLIDKNESDSLSNDEVLVTFKTEFSEIANKVTLKIYCNGEFSDELVGSPFIAENGDMDVKFKLEDEDVLLSELKEDSLIEECGWLSKFCKKVAVKALMVATVAVAVAVAAPVLATVIGPTIVSSLVLVSECVAVGAMAVSVGSALTAVVADVVEGVDGSFTINNSYRIGREFEDGLTRNLVKKVAGTATILMLREIGRSYHIAFAVCQNFSDNGKNYKVGDLYISDVSLAYDEAMLVLRESQMVNAISNITSNAHIIADVANTIITKDMSGLIEKLKGFKSNGYFSSKTQGIYAESATDAAALAAVSGAWIKDKDAGFVGYGGVGGYNHFHDLAKTIHIWYGSKL